MIDRNSVADWGSAKGNVETTTIEYVEAIKHVAKTISQNGYDSRELPWPGNVYFEDISGESSLDLIELIIGATLEHGALKV